MNILHLSSESTWRGGEQQIAYLIEELEQKNIKPVVAGRPNSAFHEYCSKRQWDYFPLEMKNSLDFRSAKQLKKLCTQLQIDVIHAHSSRSHGIAYLSYLLGNKTKLVVSRRVDFPLKNNWLSRHKYNIPVLKKIACVSDAIRDMVRPALKNANNCITIYSGIDISKFSEYAGSQYLKETYKLSNDDTIIVNTSAIAPHKDYFTFVDTVAYFLEHFHRKVKFFIIGSGPLEAEIKEYIEEKNVADYIIMTGHLSSVVNVLPSADIFFISSKTEGLGTSILDAFAAKVAVVATEAGGIPELVKHEETGLLAPIQQPKKLAEYIKRLIENKTLKNQLVENASLYAANFSKEKMAESYRQLYSEILT